MKYTWADIQIAAIQKMFLNNKMITVDDLEALRQEKKYNLYLNSMPDAANEALIRIMSIGRPIVKKYLISYNIPEEIYDYSSYNTTIISNEDYIIEGGITKAYYFEISDTANIEIQKYNNETNTWELLELIEHVTDVTGGYLAVKGLIENSSDKIRFVFKAEGYLYNVRNIALYNVSFRLEDDIFTHTQKIKYDLAELIPDFYELISVEYEKDGRRGVFDTYTLLEGDKTLNIDSVYKGNFIITYKAYPEKITAETDDSYVFDMPAEMAVLIPTYIASELYKDDDISIATVYRNQFEVALDNIKYVENPTEFADTSGWL